LAQTTVDFLFFLILRDFNLV